MDQSRIVELGTHVQLLAKVVTIHACIPQRINELLLGSRAWKTGRTNGFNFYLRFLLQNYYRLISVVFYVMGLVFQVDVWLHYGVIFAF